MFIGESFGLNGRLVGDAVLDVWAGDDKLIVVDGDGGVSGCALLTLPPLLLKSMGAAAAHIDEQEVQELFEAERAVVSHFEVGGALLLGGGEDGDRLSSLLLLKTAARASSQVGIVALAFIVGVGVVGLVVGVVG